MATVFKVRNMPLIVDNSIHVAPSEEDEVVAAMADRHSVVAVVDLSEVNDKY